MTVLVQGFGRGLFSGLGAAGCVSAFIAILIEMGDRSPFSLVVLGGLTAVSFAGEAVYRRFRKTAHGA